MGILRPLVALLVTLLTVPAEATEPIDVMVLGTYHFANPGRDLANAKADDVLKPQRQRELEALVAALTEYRPTKIMVERQANTPDLVDPRFTEFRITDLGKNRDERVQIAYRLAHQLGHGTVYAIDEQPGEGEPDYFPFGKVAKWAAVNNAKPRLDSYLAEAQKVVGSIEKLQAEGTIANVLLEPNRPEQVEKDQQFYYSLFTFGDTEQQPGAELNAYWFMCNSKIFTKLMTVAKPGDRILVVYGAGHNYWLRHFAGTTPGYRNVDPTPFLSKTGVSKAR